MFNAFIKSLGSYIQMMKKASVRPENKKIFYKEFIANCSSVGLRTFVLITFVSFFLGMICALLGVYMLNSPVIPKYVIGMLVREMMLLELGPLAISALLANVVGFSITYDLGRKKQHDLLDCLELMGINVPAFYIQPQTLAFLVMAPCLIIISCFVSVLGGWFYGVATGIISTDQYMQGLLTEVKMKSVAIFFVKTYIFSFLIPTISCFLGLTFNGNSLELNRRATFSIILNCIVLIIFDYFITALML